MTFIRQTKAENRAEHRARFKVWVHNRIETAAFETETRILEAMRREEGMQKTHPILETMTSAQLLDALLDASSGAEFDLPCDPEDYLDVLLIELDRRRNATAHERMEMRRRDTYG